MEGSLCWDLKLLKYRYNNMINKIYILVYLMCFGDFKTYNGWWSYTFFFIAVNESMYF